MKNQLLTIHKIGLTLLTLGLGSCSSDKDFKQLPTAEIKLKAPLIFNSKDGRQVSISSILPDSVVDSSDWIHFTGFSRRNTNDPIQLITKATCTHSGREQRLETTRPLSLTLQVSELLPTEYFFDLQKPYPSDLECNFDFKALEPSSQASHRFSLKTRVSISPQMSPAIEFSHNQVLITGPETKVILSLQKLENSTLNSDRSDSFQLHCQNFTAELNLGGGKLKVGREIWLDPDLLSRQPAKEKPLQLCRILGYRQKFITSWSSYFYLKNPQDLPQLEWLTPTQRLRYRGRQSLPKIVAAQVNLYNPHLYPQLIQIHKQLPLHITPICVLLFRSSTLTRSPTTTITLKQKVELIYENDHHAIYKVFPFGEFSVEYALYGRVDCKCPMVITEPPRHLPVDIFKPFFTILPPYRDNEAGFFLQASDLSSAIEIVAINPHTEQEFQSLQSLRPNTPPPLIWVENQIPMYDRSFPKTVDDLHSAEEKFGICH